MSDHDHDHTHDTEPEATPVEQADEPSGDAAADAKREAANAKREATKLRKELEAIRAAEEERKLAELSELERAQARAEAAERAVQEIRAEAARTQREAWLRDAARDARLDPDVAVALLHGRDVEGAADAVAEVTQLVAAKPHLVTPATGEAPRVGVPTSAPPVADEDPEKTLGNFLLGVLGRR